MVKRSRGDPGESGAKQGVLYYSDVRSAFGVLRRPRHFLQQYFLQNNVQHTHMSLTTTRLLL